MKRSTSAISSELFALCLKLQDVRVFEQLQVYERRWVDSQDAIGEVRRCIRDGNLSPTCEESFVADNADNYRRAMKAVEDVNRLTFLLHEHHPDLADYFPSGRTSAYTPDTRAAQVVRVLDKLVERQKGVNTAVQDWATAKELAAMIGIVPDNAFDAKLRRIRDRMPTCYRSVEAQKRSDPSYLYRVSDVIDHLR